MPRGEANFECCWSANCSESWEEVFGHDAEDAAERYAQDLCDADPATYSSFTGGEDITVRDITTKAECGVFTVVCEMIPDFNATRKREHAL